MASDIVHFEIYVNDVERAKKFYEEVFGWAFKPMEDMGMNYTLVFPGGKVMDGPAEKGVNGGMLKRPGPSADDKAAPNAFVCTLSVDDVDATVKKAVANGARVDMKPDDIPGVGRFAYIRDTEMNLVGVLKPLPMG